MTESERCDSTFHELIDWRCSLPKGHKIPAYHEQRHQGDGRVIQRWNDEGRAVHFAH